MNKLIELGVVSEDTRATFLGVVEDFTSIPSQNPGMCLYLKIPSSPGTGPNERPCGT